VLNGLGQFHEALAAYDRALALDPGNAQTWHSRGNVLLVLLRFAEAIAAYERAVALAPDFAAAFSNRGVALQNLRRFDEAEQSLLRAIALAPDMAEARVNLALLYLLLGRWQEAWPLFEWRKRQVVPLEAREYAQPLWTGAEDIAGKTLFVYCEQGLGDAIQFYRYLALVRGARLVLSIPDSMVRLLSRATPQVELIGWNAIPAQFDAHIPLASLALALGVTADAIPAPGRYLQAEPDRVTAWRGKLGRHGFRIGIAWQGNEAILGSEGKSFAVAALAAIARMPGVRLISLQKNAGSEQLSALPPGMVEHYDFDTGSDAFLDTAAIIENCDLVIACDTSVAHLGAPCWVALKYVPDWRWFLDRTDTPWYPSLRLFRQPAPGDWDSVFAAMATALRPFVE
jgi:hypothetical protein